MMMRSKEEYTERGQQQLARQRFTHLNRLLIRALRLYSLTERLMVQLQGLTQAFKVIFGLDMSLVSCRLYPVQRKRFVFFHLFTLQVVLC